MVVARRQFTVQEYHRMRNAGIFAEDDRVELLDGEVVLMSPIGPLHAAIVRRLNAILSQAVGHQFLLSVQDPIQLSDLSEPQPDLALLQYRADYYGSSHPQPAEIELLIEVSDTSLDYDREQKLPRYAESGIREVWLVDLSHQQIEQYIDPANGSYRTKQTWIHGQTLTSPHLAMLSIHVDDILG
ncbi:Uma2 family endonuclease [Candidatus Chloroploca sp. M-50]|uniref:Uma2 family endonuclease n=1 Tax=Candidatus Chloroploca mongolica TaxID=2528176 RepID=A0ABS4DC68_9CHLR|nr:Uma2 family endonuclease [Candidatus Chloroploca mongolica]MBP1467038.1 Uma2 family endonuclease [Candidatus Chloroploca mongolica]